MMLHCQTSKNSNWWHRTKRTPFGSVWSVHHTVSWQAVVCYRCVYCQLPAVSHVFCILCPAFSWCWHCPWRQLLLSAVSPRRGQTERPCTDHSGAGTQWQTYDEGRRRICQFVQSETCPGAAG